MGTDCLQPAAAKDRKRELTAVDNRTVEHSQDLQLEGRKELVDTRIREQVDTQIRGQVDMRIQELEGSQFEEDRATVVVVDKSAAEGNQVGEGSQAVVDTRQLAEGSHRRSQPEWYTE